MATDATGAPTPLGIPKYNTSVDAPSGLGFNAAMDAIDSIITAKALPTAGGSNRVPVWNGSSWVAQQIDNNQIAAGAGISGSKLNWSEGASPPGSPSVGDLWLLHPTTGVDWLFQYEPDQDATYPWMFVGGANVAVVSDTDFNTAGGAIGPQHTLARAGQYNLDFWVDLSGTPNAGTAWFWTVELGLSTGGFGEPWRAQFGNYTHIGGVSHAVTLALGPRVATITAGQILDLWTTAVNWNIGGSKRGYNIQPIRVA